MVQAVVSAAESSQFLQELEKKRLAQLNATHGQDFELKVEQKNLEELLDIAKILGKVKTTEVVGIMSIIPHLMRDVDVFLGFPVLPDDNRPHIHHVKTIVPGGFASDQGPLSTHKFTEGIMTQRLVAFINSR